MEFFLNVSLNSVNSQTEIFVIAVNELEPATFYYLSASKTHVIERALN